MVKQMRQFCDKDTAHYGEQRHEIAIFEQRMPITNANNIYGLGC